MADQDGMTFRADHVEIEVTASAGTFDLSADGVLFQLGASWVAMQALASLDPQARTWIRTDLAHALDELAFGLRLTDHATGTDLLHAHVAAVLADPATSLDTIRAGIERQLADLAAAVDSLAIAVARMDAAAAVDALVLSLRRQVADTAAARAQVLGNIEAAIADGATSADAGALHSQTYALDYVEPDYVGEQTILF